MSWGHDARSLPKATPAPAAASTHAAAGGSRNVLSPQQRSQILNNLLSQPTQSYGAYVPAPAPSTHAPASAHDQYKGGWQQQSTKQQTEKHNQEGRKTKDSRKEQHYPAQQQRQRSQQSWDGWGGGGGDNNWGSDGNLGNGGDGWEGDDDGWEGGGGGWENGDNDWEDGDGWGDTGDEENDGYDHGYSRKVRFSAPEAAPPAPIHKTTHKTTHKAPPKAAPKTAPPLGMTMGASYTMPSKTLAHAYQGTTNPTMLNSGLSRNGMQDYADIRFNESKGAALMSVQHAFYGQSRRAKDRIHWAFPPDKDERVASLLSWIQAVSYGLGSFGVCLFATFTLLNMAHCRFPAP